MQTAREPESRGIQISFTLNGIKIVGDDGERFVSGEERCLAQEKPLIHPYELDWSCVVLARQGGTVGGTAERNGTERRDAECIGPLT